MPKPSPQRQTSAHSLGALLKSADGIMRKAKRPNAGLMRLQAETAAELDALLPAILDRAFKGEL